MIQYFFIFLTYFFIFSIERKKRRGRAFFQRESYADIISEMAPVPRGKAGLPPKPIRK